MGSQRVGHDVITEQQQHAAQYQKKKKKQPDQNVAGKPKQTFLQRRHTGGQQTHQKMLNISHY